jgi:hypothetical protein
MTKDLITDLVAKVEEDESVVDADSAHLIWQMGQKAQKLCFWELGDLFEYFEETWSDFLKLTRGAYRNEYKTMLAFAKHESTFF